MHPDFRGNALRVQNRPALHAKILEVPGTLTSGELLSRLDGANITNAQLRSMHDFSAYRQLAERDRWQNVDSPVRPVRSLIPPVTSRETGFRMGPVSAIGQHAEQILAELGLAL